MSRPTDWSPVGYSSDPVPGDPVRVQTIGRLYVGTADAIDRAASNISTALGDDFGRSQAVDAIREQAEEVARRIGMAEERYRGVGDAMIAYAPRLQTAQSDSATALQLAIDAAGAGARAAGMVDYYQDRIADPATPPANLPALQSSLQRWQTEASTARAGAGSAQQQVRAAIDARDAAANAAVQAIRDVENSGDLNDSMWDEVVQWVQENQDTLDLIVEILGYIATAVMVVALFVPGLNVVVGIVATVAAVATIVNAGLQVAAGTMSVGEALFNVALAALTFVGGRAIGQGMQRIIQTARPGVASGVMGGAARAGIRGVTREVAASRVATAWNVSRPRQLSLIERVRYLNLDFREVAALRNVANLETAMGNMTTAGRQAMQELNTLAAWSWGLEGGARVVEQAGAAAFDAAAPPASRLGGSW